MTTVTGLPDEQAGGDDAAPDAHTVRAPPRYGTAAVAGVIAGTVMSMTMMLVASLHGQSVWIMPNLIAAMWLGDDVADGRLTGATAVGFATHMATSALMGWVAVPFLRDLPPGRTVLVAVSYALASYPLVFATVLIWANPLMVQCSELVPMTLAHVLFGVVLGLVYLRITPVAAFAKAPPM